MAGQNQHQCGCCALGWLQGLPFHELFKALFDAINGDKTGRQQLYGILLRLFFYEELPPDLIQQLVPLLQASMPAPLTADKPKPDNSRVALLATSVLTSVCTQRCLESRAGTVE